MTFEQRIRHHRLRQGITVLVASRNAGVSPTTWHHWESGRRKPLLDRAGAIANALAIPADALFTDELVLRVVVGEDTVQRCRTEGRQAATDAAKRLAAMLEPEIWAAATRPAVSIRPGARAKPRQSRTERLAALNARPKRSARTIE